MTYTKRGDAVVLQMSSEDYDQLLIMLGFALGKVNADDADRSRLFYSWLEFVNNLNNGNPHWTPYEIPEQ